MINTEDRTVVRKYIGSVAASHKAVTSECIAHIRGEKVSKYVANILLLISGPSCKCIASGMYPAKFLSFCINHIQTVFAWDPSIHQSINTLWFLVLWESQFLFSTKFIKVLKWSEIVLEEWKSIMHVNNTIQLHYHYEETMDWRYANYKHFSHVVSTHSVM